MADMGVAMGVARLSAIFLIGSIGSMTTFMS